MTPPRKPPLQFGLRHLFAPDGGRRGLGLVALDRPHDPSATIEGMIRIPIDPLAHLKSLNVEADEGRERRALSDDELTRW